MTLPQLRTAAVWNKTVQQEASMGAVTPVLITLYPLRRPVDYVIEHRLTDLAPNRALFSVKDRASFEQAFTGLLEQRWERAEADLAAIGDQHRGVPIVMLCWESTITSWCHRQTVARFIEARLGVEVPELRGS